MLNMMLNMTRLVLIYIIVTMVVWFWIQNKKLSKRHRLILGVLFGVSSVLSTHWGYSYENLIINLRDMGPLIAGLFFSSAAGVVAGLIGGIERFIAGTYFGIGEYTTVACSLSTCMAGFVTLAMNKLLLKGKKPSPAYALFMGAVVEVFHMYAVFITHRNDMRMAFHVVSICAIPMIIFTGFGLAIIATIIRYFSPEKRSIFTKLENNQIPISERFQKWLFIVTAIVIIGSFLFSYYIQTESAYQYGRNSIRNTVTVLKDRYLDGDKNLTPATDVDYDIITIDGFVIMGEHAGQFVSNKKVAVLTQRVGEKCFEYKFFEEDSLNKVETLDSDKVLLVSIKDSDLYWYRNAECFEVGLADILLFTVIYVLISILVNKLVVKDISRINTSLAKITDGDLNEVVDVQSSLELAELSSDINHTVDALKGYIDAAEKRMEQELIMARLIQKSALPNNFDLPFKDEFRIYATMKAAKEVGGDFYDFFFIDRYKMALVIADVSGKGIPAAMFMMRSKASIKSMAESGHSPSDILYKVNNVLCDGNDADMFVTVWLGIIDLRTGHMECANAGHEYPIIKRAGGNFELFTDKHSLALAAMENIKAKEYEIQLNPGDTLFVYTDGVPEAINESVEQYGTDRLIYTLNANKDSEVGELLAAVQESVDVFKGNSEQFDDITMMAFEFRTPLIPKI